MKVGQRVRVTDGYMAYRMRSAKVKTGWCGIAIDENKSSNNMLVHFDNGSVNGAGDNGWWVPVSCLELLDSGVAVETTTSASTPSRESETKTMVYRITVIATPSTLAQQAGETEKVLVDNETVVALDPYGASFVAGTQNADVLKDTKASVRVVVTTV